MFKFFLLKHAAFCKFFTNVISSTNKSSTFLLSSDSHSFTLFLLYIFFLGFSFFLIFPGTSGRNYPFSLPPLLSGYSGYPVIHFFQAMTLQMSRADKVHCFSHLASVGVYLSYSRTRGVLSHQNVSAQKSL